MKQTVILILKMLIWLCITDVEIIAGHGGLGNSLDQLNWPAGIFVDDYGALYIADTNNNRIVRMLAGSKTGIVIAGGKHQGNASDQLMIPFDVTLDSDGNLYIADTRNHRIQMFAIDPNSCREDSSE
jgi:sugar lactone lactonase YvrE